MCIATADYYVDPSSGLDANPGTAAMPFKTLTHALSVVAAAGGARRVQALRGTFNAGNGETFPLTVPSNCKLVGDEATRGTGGGGTIITGDGPTTGYIASLIPSAGSSVSGIQFVVSSAVVHFGVEVGSDGAAGTAIALNTFTTGYGGIHMSGGAPLIENNTFATSSYGTYGDCSATIRNNDFQQIALPLDFTSASAGCQVTTNTILGNGEVGIQVQSGAPSINGNTFTRTSNYTYGAFLIRSTSTAVLRNNVIQLTAGPAITTIDSATPDLGTAASPGGNTLGSGAVVGLAHSSTSNVNAYGNTWAHNPPSCGVDIKRDAGAGTVTFGPGQSCP
jgi:hypothetical protein